MTKTLTDRVLGLLFPETCPTCGGIARSHRTAPFCDACWAGLHPYEGPLCRLCGLPLPSAHADLCGECLGQPPAYCWHRSFGLYAGTLREAIHRLKYGMVRRLAFPLAGLWSEMTTPEADFIVPVPLHPDRLKQREFNQVGLLARHLSKRTGIPVDILSLEKVRNTPPQVGLPRRQRLTNERRAFRMAGGTRLTGRRVILVDDVATTGATVRACSEVLARSGVSEIYGLTLARSTPDVWEGTKEAMAN